MGWVEKREKVVAGHTELYLNLDFWPDPTWGQVVLRHIRLPYSGLRFLLLLSGFEEKINCFDLCVYCHSFTLVVFN